MNINSFIKYLKVKKLIENNQGGFNKPEFDSRKIDQNDLFVAIKGSMTDGHKYIQEVIDKGVSVIVCEELPKNPNNKVSWIVVLSSSESLGIIASHYYGLPSERIKLVGITGTNGKTTIATSLYNLTIRLGYKCGLISTNKIMLNTAEIPSELTTPDALQLNKLLSEMIEIGCDYCFMEVSSHAVIQGRISGMAYSGAVFTNITHDHLDYHKTFDEYLQAKKSFFDILPHKAFALTNSDDKNGKVMLQNTKAQKFTYSLRAGSDFKASIIEKHPEGMLLNIENSELWTKFIGKFNAYNILAIYATAVLLGFDKQEILKEISTLSMVEGRFENIISKNNITAIIDYAHTPDALENVLLTIDDLKPKNSILTTVVGCGGNRDKSKRPVMGKIAVKFSDKVILTSDNPRDENPAEIIADMLQGIDSNYRKRVIVITDRKEAIRTACLISNPQDIVLVAGKGHEKYQDIKGVKYDFDDKKIVVETFNEL